MARGYEIATRSMAKEFDIELIDVENFACCGFPIRSADVETARLLAARNLSIAEERGLDICTICTGCEGTIIRTNKELIENSELRGEVNKKLCKIGREYRGGVTVKHFAKVLYKDVGLEKIKGKVKRRLEHLTIASHYGCHYLKPSHVYGKGEDLEFPTSLEELVALTGAKCIDYEDKIQCCGGNIIGINERLTFNIASRKLDHIKNVGADAMNLVCPLCSIVYDRNQTVIERMVKKSYGLPVLFYPQILGLALGLDPEELGFDMNRVKVSGLLNKI